MALGGKEMNKVNRNSPATIKILFHKVSFVFPRFSNLDPLDPRLFTHVKKGLEPEKFFNEDLKSILLVIIRIGALYILYIVCDLDPVNKSV